MLLFKELATAPNSNLDRVINAVANAMLVNPYNLLSDSFTFFKKIEQVLALD